MASILQRLRQHNRERASRLSTEELFALLERRKFTPFAAGLVLGLGMYYFYRLLFHQVGDLFIGIVLLITIVVIRGETAFVKYNVIPELRRRFNLEPSEQSQQTDPCAQLRNRIARDQLLQEQLAYPSGKKRLLILTLLLLLAFVVAVLYFRQLMMPYMVSK